MHLKRFRSNNVRDALRAVREALGVTACQRRSTRGNFSAKFLYLPEEVTRLIAETFRAALHTGRRQQRLIGGGWHVLAACQVRGMPAQSLLDLL